MQKIVLSNTHIFFFALITTNFNKTEVKYSLLKVVVTVKLIAIFATLKYGKMHRIN